MLCEDFFRKWGIRAKGIIHIGAHHCEERHIYANVGCDDSKVIWIEGNPEICRFVQEHMPSSIHLYQALISDGEKEVDFIVTNNGVSSSMLDLKEHLVVHPHVIEDHRLKLQTTTLPIFLEKNNIKYENYDFLIMDIQGAELLALKGMSNILQNFKHIFLEVNKTEIYAGCALFPEVIEYLDQYGFKLRDFHMFDEGYGDAYFVTSNKG